MSHRMWRALPKAVILLLVATARGQVVPDVPPSPSRSELPFAVEPDRLPGPPRAMGEVPEGSSQPPSTLPGRVFGQPPRAMGEAPVAPGGPPAFGPFTPGLAPGSGGFFPFGATGGGVGSPAGSSFVPGSFRPPGGVGGEVPPPPSDLPPALPDDGRAAPLVPPGTSAERSAAPPLTLDEVLSSSERTYPPYLAILQERVIASGDLLSARGAFDLNLNADSRNYPLGYYDRGVHDVFLEQPLRWNGAKVFAGYRLAQGQFPNYYNYLNTRGGAFVSGFEVPLLRNREIDARRAKEVQAEIERRKVEPTILKQRIDLFKNVSKLYWNWVAAGQTLAIYRDLVRVAEARNEGLDRQLREGLLRAIDLVDFRRILLSRQQQAVAADRRFQQAAIEVSLFFRNDLGFPLLPDPARLPRGFPAASAIDPARFSEDMEVASRLRPEALAVRLEARKAQVDRQFARNQLLPSLNLYVYTEQNVGNRDVDLGKDFRPFIMESSLLFDVPLQRRYARGRVIVADATLRQIHARAQFAADRIRADVMDATSAVRTSYEQLVRYREAEALNRRLEAAETTLVREGSSTILFLNLREQAVSDATVARIEAEAKFHASLADYRAALGLDAASPGH